MAREHTFHCDVITPERAVLNCEATFVAFPAHDGEMGVLPHRAPLICKLGIGPLRVEATDGEHRFFVAGGFAQVGGNRLTLLTERARPIAELKREEVRKSLSDARAMHVTDEASFAARQNAVRSAEVQLKLAPT